MSGMAEVGMVVRLFVGGEREGMLRFVLVD